MVSKSSFVEEIVNRLQWDGYHKDAVLVQKAHDFIRALLTGCFTDELPLDYEAQQTICELALKHGVLVEEAFDPEKHKDLTNIDDLEPGEDNVWVWSEQWQRTISKAPENTASEQSSSGSLPSIQTPDEDSSMGLNEFTDSN